MAVATLGPAAASVTITADGDMVTVTLNDTSNSADEIESAIEDHGLDIDIEEVPVGPSNYGRFVSYTTDQSKHFDERSEESRVGKGCDSTGSSRGSPYH